MIQNNFVAIGNDKDKFFDTLKKMTDITKVLELSTDQIQMFTVNKVSDDGNLIGYLHTANSSVGYEIKKDDLIADGMTPELLDETMNESHLLFKFGSHYFFTTLSVLRTLTQRAGSKMGDFALKDDIKIRFHRDAGYMTYMGLYPSECKVLFKQEGNAKKVFSVFSDRYQIIPQEKIIGGLFKSFEKEMGKSEILEYQIDNYATDIILKFPEKEKDFSQVYNLPDTMTPGIHIHVSDVGESSFVINGAYIKGRNILYIPDALYTRAHTKYADVDEIKDVVEKKIFSEYTKIPQRLLDLLSININDPEKAIDKVTQYIGIKKTLGKKRTISLSEELKMSLSPIQYTAYDIASLFMDKAESLTNSSKSEEYTTRIREALMKAPFYSFEKL